MKIAITGGTGFVGRNLARRFVEVGHEVVLIARGCDRSGDDVARLPGLRLIAMNLDNPRDLARAFEGCEAVAHCAGINREIGEQTYQRVHIDGTRNVVAAAKTAGVKKTLLMSFLRARPNCGAGYHESKFAAEEIVRNSGLGYTVLKCGVIYGRGDHMLDHLSHAFHTFPIFLFVGFQDQGIRPTAVEDITRIAEASLVNGRLSRETVVVVGPEELTLRGAVRRVAGVVGRKPLMFPAPVWFHRCLGWVVERAMKVPLVSTAQVKMLAEGLVEAAPTCGTLPDDLAPKIRFSEEQIRDGLPPAGPFKLRDIRCCSHLPSHRHAAFLEIP